MKRKFLLCLTAGLLMASLAVPGGAENATLEAESRILGDLDNNGTVDVGDAMTLFRHSMFPDIYPIDYPGTLDLDKDGNEKANIDDAMRLFRYSMSSELYPIEWGTGHEGIDLDEAFLDGQYSSGTLNWKLYRFYTDDYNITLNYRLYLPADYNENEQYPLLVYLHGKELQGTDNDKPLEEAKMMFSHPVSPAYDSIVLVPQCPEGKAWEGVILDALMGLVEKTHTTYSIDLDRQYYVGSTIGADGVWELMERYPEHISAAVSSSGKGVHFLKYDDGTISPIEFSDSMTEIPLCIAYTQTAYSTTGLDIGEDYVNMLWDFLREEGAENMVRKEIIGQNENESPLLVTEDDISVLTWLYKQRRPAVAEMKKITDKLPPAEHAKFSAKESFTVDHFTASNGVSLAYAYYIPEGYDETKEYPVLLFLHSHGAQGTDGVRHLTQIDGYFVNAESPVYDSIVLMPQCPPDTVWAGQNIDAVVELLDAFTANYNTDPSRRYVAGVSLGSWGTWDMLLRYPEHVSAAVPVALESLTSFQNNEDGTTTPGSFDQRVLEVPIFYVYDLFDDLSSSLRQRSVVQTLLDYGANLTYRESVGYGHFICGYHVTVRDISVLEWLYAQRRDTTLPIE